MDKAKPGLNTEHPISITNVLKIYKKPLSLCRLEPSYKVLANFHISKLTQSILITTSVDPVYKCMVKDKIVLSISEMSQNHTWKKCTLENERFLQNVTFLI